MRITSIPLPKRDFPLRIEIKKFDRRLDAVIGIAALLVAIGTTIWTLTTQSSYGRGQASYLLLFISTLLGSSTIFVPAPNIATIVFHATTLSPTLVIIYGGIGWGLGEITGYIVGRLGHLTVEDVNPKFKSLWDRFRPIVIFSLACIPNPVFDVISVLSGSLRVPVGEFLLATILGRITATAIWVGITIGFGKLIGFG